MNNKKTLFDKIWDSHVDKKVDNGPDILFIDRHLIHEVTSPVAFLGLKNRNLNVMYPNLTFALQITILQLLINICQLEILYLQNNFKLLKTILKNTI